MRRWIRSGSRSITSTPSASGARRTPGRRSTRPGTLPDGSTFQGLDGLRTLLDSRREQFVATVTEKLLAYALGRGLEAYDMPAVRKIVRDAARRRPSLVVDRARHRRQRAVSDESGESGN